MHVLIDIAHSPREAVEVANAAARSERDGEVVYFCSDHCRHRFEAAGRVEEEV